MVARILLPAVLTILLITAAAMGREGRTMDELRISSPAFAHRGEIPSRFTCDGHDVNPALEFGPAPAGARSLALIVDDPDAPVGDWVHWLVWNIPPATRGIKENGFPAEAVQGLNGWKTNRYGGPCPPSGTHRYFFRLYALDITLSLPKASTKADLEWAMRGHILASGELMGTYRHH